MAGLDERAGKRKTSFDLELASCELAAVAYLECRSQSPDLGGQLKSRLKELHERAKTEKWTPAVLASAMDGLDRLGYVPEDLHHFLPIPNAPFPNSYLAKYPITNAQYERFLKPENFQNKDLWMDFPKYDENSKPFTLSGAEGGTWGASIVATLMTSSYQS